MAQIIAIRSFINNLQFSESKYDFNFIVQIFESCKGHKAIIKAEQRL